MNDLWIVAAAIVALAVFARMRSRRAIVPERRQPSAGPRIQGAQIVAYLHPRMSAACLFDHGLQYGKGFRRKEGPQLPHSPECRCASVPFAFSSSEVFNGALRNVGEVKSSVPGLKPPDAARLIERLRNVEAQALPAAAADYAAAIGVDAFPPDVQPALRAFAEERHRFLQSAAAEAPGHTGPLTPDRMDSSEPT